MIPVAQIKANEDLLRSPDDPFQVQKNPMKFGGNYVAQ